MVRNAPGNGGPIADGKPKWVVVSPNPGLNKISEVMIYPAFRGPMPTDSRDGQPVFSWLIVSDQTGNSLTASFCAMSTAPPR
jgi:hypothetical protein